MQDELHDCEDARDGQHAADAVRLLREELARLRGKLDEAIYTSMKTPQKDADSLTTQT